jgi:phytoene desaturase
VSRRDGEGASTLRLATRPRDGAAARAAPAVHGSRPRVVVIGAGPGGLAAAMLLANRGAAVTVLERMDRVGGRSGGLDSAGYRFDTGPTFFLYPQVLRAVFAACGRRLEDEIDLIRLDPQYDLVFEGGGKLRATGDVARMQAEIAGLSPRDAANLPAFLADNEAKLAAFRPVLENAFTSPLHYLRPGVLRALPLLRPLRSVDADLKRYFRDPRVRLAFSFQSKYLGMSPFNCPSLFTILAFMEYAHGVFHPRGGTAAVMQRMAAIAQDMGVEIRTGEDVEAIRFAGRRAVGVASATGERRADAVVVNADFGQAMARLVPDALRRRWTDAKLAAKRYSCSTFMLYLGVEGAAEGRADAPAHHTISLARDYRRNIAEVQAGTAPPDDPSFYVQNAAVTDPDLAPPGHGALYVLAPVANLAGGIDWDRHRDAFRRKLLAKVEALGFADIERRIRFEKLLTPADWRDDFAVYRGATFNLAHTLGQMLYLRPRNRFEDLDAVYLVGGGTHPGSGLPVIFQSALITADLMAADLGLTAAAPAAAALAAE